jgi:hypothetical protein
MFLCAMLAVVGSPLAYAHRQPPALPPLLCVFIANPRGGESMPGEPETIAATRPTPDVQSLARVLREPTTPEDLRLDAAQRLLDASGTPDADALIDELLASTARTPEQDTFLIAIGRASVAPRGVLGHLTRIARASDAARLPPVLGAIGAVRTLDAARVLWEFSLGGRGVEAADAAFDQLERLTGRTDVARDAAAWSDFLAEAGTWSEDRWQRELASSLARRADRLAGQSRAATSRLLDNLRRLHLATPEDAQGEFLAGLLGDSLPEVRSLGFELIARELSAGTRLDDKVGRMLLPLLREPSARERQQAAALINQLVPGEAAEPVREALDRERDPRAAAALLLAAARWPDERMAPPALAWLAREAPARDAAATLLLAMLRAGKLDSPDDRDACLDGLREVRADPPTPAQAQLLALLGDDADRMTVASWFTARDGSLRVAAAEALAPDADFLNGVLDAARLDSALFDTACRAVILHQPDAARFRELAMLPAPSIEARRRGLAAVARVMPAAAVVRVSGDDDDDDAMREVVLEQLASVERVLSERDNPEDLMAILRGLPLLARVRIEAGRYDAALAALAPLAEIPGGEDSPQAVHERCVALLCLDRVEQAAALNASASAWLDAIERRDPPDAARPLLDLFRSKFPAALMPDESVRLNAILTRLRNGVETPPRR